MAWEHHAHKNPNQVAPLLPDNLEIDVVQIPSESMPGIIALARMAMGYPVDVDINVVGHALDKWSEELSDHAVENPDQIADLAVILGTHPDSSIRQYAVYLLGGLIEGYDALGRDIAPWTVLMDRFIEDPDISDDYLSVLTSRLALSDEKSPLSEKNRKVVGAVWYRHYGDY